MSTSKAKVEVRDGFLDGHHYQVYRRNRVLIEWFPVGPPWKTLGGAEMAIKSYRKDPVFRGGKWRIVKVSFTHEIVKESR